MARTNRTKRLSGGTAIFALVAMAVVAIAGVGMVSLALFTDQESVNGNTFTTGSVNLTVDVPTALLTFTSPAMIPGDAVTSELTVGNGGSLDLRYALSSVTTEDVLAAQLVLTIKTGVSTCSNAGFTVDGAQIYQGVLGSTGGSAILGSNAAGADVGDRTLVAAANEALCFNVEFPSGSGNPFQGLTSTAVFTFDAEQTINNP